MLAPERPEPPSAHRGAQPQPEETPQRADHAQRVSETAAAAFNAVLTVSDTLLGADAPDSSASARHELAREALRSGDDNAVRIAAEGFQTVLEGRTRVLGPEHPDTLTALHDVARMDLQRGDLDAAESGFRAVLAARERVSGAEHPETLAAWHNLASVQMRRGDLAAAEQGFRAVLAARERVSGPEHPYTLIVRHELATVAFQRGDLAAAEQGFGAVLASCQRLLLSASTRQPPTSP